MKYLILLFIFTSTVFAKDYVVEFKKVPNISKNLKGFSLSRFDNYPSDYYSRLYNVSSELSEHELVLELNKIEKVEKLEPVVEFASEMSIIPAKEAAFDDIYSPYQWALNNQGQSLLVDYDDITSLKLKGLPGFDLGLKAAKEKLAKINKEVIVAVIDSGLDLEHPELKDRIFKNEVECLKGDLHFRPTVDNDKNGYIGDCMGWNFAAEKEGNHRPYDDTGHGTHVAGVISALSDNARGISGVAQFVKILPIKVSKKVEAAAKKVLGKVVDNSSNAQTNNTIAAITISSKVAKAILYAIKMKANVINISLGWPKALDLKYVREAFKEAHKNNIVIIAAAGNNNTYQSVYPCSYDEVICVGALTIDGTKASFSNWGGMVDIMAPGEQILSLFPKTLVPDFFSISGYEVKSGTSQASPYVAAGAAMVKALLPDVDNDAVRRILMTATKNVDLGPNFWVSSGLLRYDRLLELATDPSFYVIPKIKSLDQVLLMGDDKNFKFSLVFNQQNSKPTTTEVIFSTKTPGIEIENKNFKFSNESGVSVAANINASIENLEGENHFVLDMLITTSVEGKTYTRVFSKHVSIVRGLNNVDIIKKTLPLTSDEKKVVILKNPLKTTFKIKSVTDQYREQNFVSYYFTQQVGTTQKLTLLSLKDDGIKKYEVIIPDSIDINIVQWLDLNLDGKADLWIRTMYEATVDGKKVQAIRYYLFDDELKPLISDLPFITFNPVVKVANLREIMFLPQNTPWGKILIPILCGDGYLPPSERETNLLITPDTQTRKRIYYYTLDKNKELITKVLDNNRFYQEMKNKYKLRHNELPDLIFFRPQSKEQLRTGKIEALFDVLGSLWVLTIAEDLKYKMTPTKTSSYFFKSQNLNTFVEVKKDLEVNYNQSGVWGHLQTDYLAQWHYLDDIINDVVKISTSTYSHTRARDNIVDMMTSFKVDGQNHTFFQTKGSLVLLRENEKAETEVFSHLIHRNSFLPGSIFTELYYPVVTKDYHPAFYVDASQLYAGYIYLIKEDDAGLRIPTRSSLVLPQDCQAMNPQRVNGLESMSVLCESNGELELNFLSF